MGEEPSDTPVPEPTDAGDDSLHLRVSRRTLRRVGFAAVLLVVAAAGIGIGLVFAGADDSDTAAPTSRRRTSTTSSLATSTTIPVATGDTAAAVGSGSSGVTEGAEEAGSDDGAEADAEAAEPAAEAPAALPAPVIPTAQLSLTAIPLGCAGVGPTLRVTWSTTNAATASLRVGGANTPILSGNGSLLLDVDCGRAIAVRLTAFSVDQHTAEANSSIVVSP